MQRLHVTDLTGFIEAGGGFHKLSLPAIAPRDEEIPLSLTECYLREKGEALHPERENVETLEQIRDQIGPHNFAAQYQQHPESPEGALFKRKWLRLISEPPTRQPGGILCVSIDSALSTAETADYSAISLIYSDVHGHHVLFAGRGRWDYEALRKKALQYVHCYGTDIYFVVEAAGSGISLISFLRKSSFRCFHHTPRDGKTTRASLALPTIHAGRVFILNKEGENSWVEPFINELVTFPQARFDDQVDSLVQVLLWAEPRVNPGGRFYHLAVG